MKKLLFVLVAVMGMAFAANAQNIGGRFGGVGSASDAGYGAELSYQHYLGSANRLEFDLGFSHRTDNYINLAAAYHWVFPIAGDFYWFIGPAVNVGHCKNHGFGLAAGVQGGAEWDPQNVPIQLAIDGRPLYDFLMDPNCAYTGFGYGVAFSVRYRIH